MSSVFLFAGFPISFPAPMDGVFQRQAKNRRPAASAMSIHGQIGRLLPATGQDDWNNHPQVSF